jgi:diguanylate cyclase (GGDEF)-like protein
MERLYAAGLFSQISGFRSFKFELFAAVEFNGALALSPGFQLGASGTNFTMAMDGMHSRRARLRWLMVAIVLVAVAPLFALSLVRLQSNSDQALQQAYEQAAAIARSGVNAHTQVSDQARHLLEVLAQIPAVRESALPECEHVMKAVLEGRGWLTGIFAVGPDGKGVCGASPIVRTLDVSDRQYFLDAVATKKFKVSDVITSRVTGTHIVAGVLPLYETNGTLKVVLGVGVSLPWINQISTEASAKFGGVMITLDANGQVLAYGSHVPDRWTIAALNDNPLVKTIMASKAPTFEAKDPAGVDRIFSVARMPDSGITIAVGLTRSEVLGSIERDFRTDILLLLFVAIASIALALLVAEFGVMRGVRALKTAALRLKAGRMGLRVTLPSFVAAELHDLATTYNAMTAEFERLAYLDRLTGLPNRRYLERHVAKHSERDGRALSGRHAVLAIDIDGFKPVNDTHGHAVGDRVLAIIARRIASVISDRGLLFRVGGDEFVAIAPLVGAQGRETARNLGEEIRQAMEQAIELDGFYFPIACSVGIAMVPDDAEHLSGALVVADAALYEAKRAGRNRVVDNAPPLAAELPAPQLVTRKRVGSGSGVW